MTGVGVRLHGVDAPEERQTCSRQAKAWSCGQAASDWLRDLVVGKQVYCTGQGKDAYGRTSAVCSGGGVELNRSLEESGWAVAFRKYSNAYVPEETRAKLAGLGIWSGIFVPPEQFRVAGRLETNPAKHSAAPSLERSRAQPRAAQSPGHGCVIKGNRNRGGEWIYHLPGMPYYDVTRPEEVFCSEAQARAAGYRRAIVRR
jgi:hypothetical protein